MHLAVVWEPQHLVSTIKRVKGSPRDVNREHRIVREYSPFSLYPPDRQYVTILVDSCDTPISLVYPSLHLLALIRYYYKRGK